MSGYTEGSAGSFLPSAPCSVPGRWTDHPPCTQTQTSTQPAPPQNRQQRLSNNKGFLKDNLPQKELLGKVLKLFQKNSLILNTLLAFAVTYQETHQNSELHTHHITHAPRTAQQPLSSAGNLWRTLMKWKFNLFSYWFHNTDHTSELYVKLLTDYLQKAKGEKKCLKMRGLPPCFNSFMKEVGNALSSSHDFPWYYETLVSAGSNTNYLAIQAMSVQINHFNFSDIKELHSTVPTEYVGLL